LERDWSDFKALYGNIAGARDQFEKACETVFRKEYSDQTVSQIAVQKGDGGIDILIGELGVSPIIVIQCKFFLDSIGDAQKAQIRDSYNRAKNNDDYTLKQWILCIPHVPTVEEMKWWSTWKNKEIITENKDDTFLKVINGNELIDIMKNHNVYNQIFKIEESLILKDIQSNVSKLSKVILPSEHSTSQDKPIPSKVLFNNYRAECEPFYLERKIDKEFTTNIKFGSIWIHGISGSGKTALINRNLIQNNIDFIYCDMSPIIIDSVDNIFDEIICCITMKYEITKINENNKIKEICRLLNTININKTNVLVIDELAVNGLNLFQTIATNFLRLVSHHNNQCNSNHLKFVISTITPPAKLLTNREKAIDCFHNIGTDSWQPYILNLMNLITCNLKVALTDAEKKIITENCKNSPRILKNIVKRLYQQDPGTKIDVESITNHVLEEIA
jgi:hypothetical protein